MQIVRKAIFPVAGFGTRFLPATKANPKEMLPVVDKPLIQYAVEEAIEAGIQELIFVTSSSKRAIEDHFDTNFELEAKLKAQGKNELLEIVHNILPRNVSCAYIRQPEAKGLGHAILCAKNLIGNEPFAVLLADDLIEARGQGCLSQMVDEFSRLKSSVIAVELILASDSEKYGVVKLAADPGSKLKTYPIEDIVEKPSANTAPSNLGVVGRYILTPAIFEQFAKTSYAPEQEWQLTDAIARLLSQESVFAYEFQGKRFDCGDKLGYLKAIVHFGLKHPQLGSGLQDYLRTILSF